MIFIGKQINYIRLHNFLDRIEVESVYSALHNFSNLIYSQLEEQDTVLWREIRFTKEKLLEALKEEHGKLTGLYFKEHSSGAPEVMLRFESGNEYVCRLKNQEQYAQIVQFLHDY